MKTRRVCSSAACLALLLAACGTRRSRPRTRRPSPSCPAAWQRGWDKLAREIDAPVYCPSWMPNPLDGRIGGQWNGLRTRRQARRLPRQLHLPGDRQRRGARELPPLAGHADAALPRARRRSRQIPCYSDPDGPRADARHRRDALHRVARRRPVASLVSLARGRRHVRRERARRAAVHVRAGQAERDAHRCAASFSSGRRREAHAQAGPRGRGCRRARRGGRVRARRPARRARRPTARGRRAVAARAARARRSADGDGQRRRGRRCRRSITRSSPHACAWTPRISPDAQRALEDALAGLERRFAPTPAGLGVDRRVGAAVLRAARARARGGEHAPLDRRAHGRQRCCAARRFPSDPDDDAARGERRRRAASQRLTSTTSPTRAKALFDELGSLRGDVDPQGLRRRRLRGRRRPAEADGAGRRRSRAPS